jgi:imidazole glycerol phosphate synthase subunit HisF
LVREVAATINIRLLLVVEFRLSRCGDVLQNGADKVSINSSAIKKSAVD